VQLAMETRQSDGVRPAMMAETKEDDRFGADRVDRARLAAIADGDRAAFDALYISYRPRLGGFLRRLTTDPELLAETYNDTMHRVWRNARQFDHRSKVSSWIFTIAYRQCLRLLEQEARRSGTRDATIVDDPVEEASVEAEGTAEAADRFARERALRAAVSRLKPKHRMVVELTYFAGHSVEEVADIAKCPVNTAKTRLHHARKQLRVLLAEDASA